MFHFQLSDTNNAKKLGKINISFFLFGCEIIFTTETANQPCLECLTTAIFFMGVKDKHLQQVYVSLNSRCRQPYCGCTHKCVALLGVDIHLPSSSCPQSFTPGYIYPHPHHKRLPLQLGHSAKGQHYFCCVDGSSVLSLPAVAGIAGPPFPSKNFGFLQPCVQGRWPTLDVLSCDVGFVCESMLTTRAPEYLICKYWI